MTTTASGRTESVGPGFIDLFTPKLVTILREGYGLRRFRADALASLAGILAVVSWSMAEKHAINVRRDV